MNEIIYVNNVALPHIQSYTVGWYDVSKDSGRDTTTADGTMILNVINKKFRLDINSTYMKQSELQSFFSQIKLGPIMTVNFFNPYTGDRQTCRMYRGDRSVQLRYKIQGQEAMYEPVSIALIEL